MQGQSLISAQDHSSPHPFTQLERFDNSPQGCDGGEWCRMSQWRMHAILRCPLVVRGFCVEEPPCSDISLQGNRCQSTVRIISGDPVHEENQFA